jgi:hypothetical protein
VQTNLCLEKQHLECALLHGHQSDGSTVCWSVENAQPHNPTAGSCTRIAKAAVVHTTYPFGNFHKECKPVPTQHILVRVEESHCKVVPESADVGPRGFCSPLTSSHFPKMAAASAAAWWGLRRCLGWFCLLLAWCSLATYVFFQVRIWDATWLVTLSTQPGLSQHTTSYGPHAMRGGCTAFKRARH